MIYVIVALLLLALEIGYFRIADHFNIIDKPNLRSSHTKVTLRGGGIIFLLGAWLFWVMFGFEYSWFILGLSLVSLVSFIDDVHSLPDAVRLLVQITAMFLMLFQFGILNLNDWWMVLVALFVCVGIINAYNFMDGINGITGGYSLAVILPMIYLNYKLDFISMPFLYVTVISLIIFCFFNFRKKAKCFAGDVGSISIAFILLFALGLLMIKTQDFSYIVFLAVYGVDATLTVIHRIMLRENLGEAHRKHAYQIMANELKMPHVNISAMYMIIQLIISAGLIFIPINHYLYLGIILVLLCTTYLLFMKKNYHLHAAYLKTLKS